MNKISKKIVALATMAAFVLTLVPAAAFAANDADVQTSSFSVVKDGVAQSEVTVDANEALTAQFFVNDNAGVGTTDTLVDNGNHLKIWAVDTATNQVTSALNQPEDVNGLGSGFTTTSVSGNIYKYASTSASVTNGNQVSVSFSRPGTYILYAGVGTDAAITDKNTAAGLTKLLGSTTITVTAQDVVTQSVKINGGSALTNGDSVDVAPNVIINGIDTDEISGVAYTDTDATAVAVGETFNVTTNSANIIVDEETVTTDNMGAFSFNYAIAKAGIYKIYISNEDIKVTVSIDASEAATLENINTTASDAQTLLAGNDSHYTTSAPANFADAVQFEITDKNGNAVKESTLTGEPAADKGDTDHSKYLSVASKPEKSALTANDLELVWDNTKEAYTLVYVGDSASTDLLPGEYTVKVSLLSGDTATASFTLAKFGTVQDLALDLKYITSGTIANSPVFGAEITDSVVLGGDIYGVVKYVDENGIEVDADSSVVLGATGDAIDTVNLTNSLPKFRINTKDNNTDNESLLGTKITITAFDENQGKMVSTDLTVVDEDVINTLAFDSEQGEANKDNTVKVSIVDENGKVVKESGSMYAYIASQSNEDANVEVTPAGVNGVANGTGDLTIFSDAETTVDIVVAVKTGDAIYANTLSYTIGEEDILADTSVVMTIGSSDFVVNNQVITMEDAAPYVANDRTYVPFRALGEAIGADVVWDNDARTVTYTLGSTEVVMTIGETTYTVNGEEKTMDVAPEITGDRTYVPVRFVGEALGFKVTALYAADGTTASVVFQK